MSEERKCPDRGSSGQVGVNRMIRDAESLGRDLAYSV